MQYPTSLAPISKQLDELFVLEQIHLVDVKVGTGSKVLLIRLMIDREDRFINIDDCAGLSKQIGGLLDQANCFPNGYRLEVSSPGLSHPLREHWEFRKHLDKKLHVFYHHQGQNKEAEGYLIEIGADTITLRSSDTETVISFNDLDYAKSVIDWHKHPSKKVG